MDRHERLSRLLELLGERGKLDVEELSSELAVSAATIRRDLDHLAAQQLLTRTRGGAVAQNVAYELPLRYKTARHAPEKERIAMAAAKMIEPGAIVGVNGGTTTTEVARALVLNADKPATGESAPLTIVTNALNIANELVVRPLVKVVVTGGVARPQSFELTGPLASRILDAISLDVLFLGVDALDAQQGAFAHNESEAETNQLMTASAKQVIVVADSSKLGCTAFTQICPISTVGALVTDSGITQELTARFTAAGLEVTAV